MHKSVLSWFAIPLLLALGLAGCGGEESASKTSGTTVAESGTAAGAQLSGVKSFLGDHTDQLTGFTNCEPEDCKANLTAMLREPVDDSSGGELFAYD